MTAAQRDFSQIGVLLDQADFVIVWLVCLMMINGKGAKHFSGSRTNRFGPARTQPRPAGEFFIGCPVRMGLDVCNDDTLAGKGCRAAGAGTDADLDTVDRGIVEIGQAGCGTGKQVFALVVEQHDAAKHGRLLLLHTTHDRFQNGGERCTMGQQFQYMIAGLLASLRLFPVGDIAGKPALDEYDVKNGSHHATAQKQGKH